MKTTAILSISYLEVDRVRWSYPDLYPKETYANWHSFRFLLL